MTAPTGMCTVLTHPQRELARARAQRGSVGLVAHAQTRSPQHMSTTTIRVREPRELLALLPYQLGFQPHESAVAVSLRPPRGRVGLVARVDLADLGDPANGPGIARALVSHLAADGARTAVLVVYTLGDPRALDDARALDDDGGRLARAAAVHFRGAAEPFLGDVPVWVVARDGYLALDCVDLDCCPPGGRPLRELESTVVGAHMVLAGALVEDTRDDLVRIPTVAAAARRNAVRVAERSRTRRAIAQERGPADLGRWRAAGLAAWRAAVTEAHGGAAHPSPAVLGRIAAALGDVAVRDAVLLALVAGTGDLPERSIEGAGGDVEHQTSDALGRVLDPSRGAPPDDDVVAAGAVVLERVVAHSGGSHQAAPLTMLALLAWWQADGPRAGVLLERALASDPTHRLGRLLAEALAAGLAPGWIGRADGTARKRPPSSGTVG